jgi:hypothetical protein
MLYKYVSFLVFSFDNLMFYDALLFLPVKGDYCFPIELTLSPLTLVIVNKLDLFRYYPSI